MKLSVIFDNKVFGSNFGSGTLAVTVLGYRNGNFEETDPVFNKAISWDCYRDPPLRRRSLIFTALPSMNLATPLGWITLTRRNPATRSCDHELSGE